MLGLFEGSLKNKICHLFLLERLILQVHTQHRYNDLVEVVGLVKKGKLIQKFQNIQNRRG